MEDPLSWMHYRFWRRVSIINPRFVFFVTGDSSSGGKAPKTFSEDAEEDSITAEDSGTSL
jgi:hypothetical protein